jgi:hypothetical protein
MVDVPTLELVQESKIADLLLDASPSVKHEASGVLAKDGKYFVVFDNRSSVARLSEDLVPHRMNGLFGIAGVDDGYEGITYNRETHRFYLLVEARKQKGGQYRAEIFEYDDTFAFVKHRPVDFTFKTDNKGFEAVTHVRRDGQDYVLALCEGNKCKSGSKGRKPGGGRVHCFKKEKKRWSHVDTIKLPKSVQFEDYSGMSMEEGRVAVVSQQNSMLWIGVFEESAWSWRDDGRLFQFPRATDGAIKYGNIEGVAWITPNRLVTVSDRRKKNAPDRIAGKDQSIHVFELP